jgi:predicted membrane-bound spermidine synthase
MRGIILLVSTLNIFYELILAQLQSSLLGGALFNYVFCVGIYITAQGAGTAAASGLVHNPRSKFIRIELLMGVLMALTPPVYGWLGLRFAAFSYLMIAIIGFLSGYELPLLMEIGQKFERISFKNTLGLDYLGMFLGCVGFGIFFEKLGLFGALIVSLFGNLWVIWLVASFPEDRKKTESWANPFPGLLLGHFVFPCLAFLFLFVMLLSKSDTLNFFMSRLYLWAIS